MYTILLYMYYLLCIRIGVHCIPSILSFQVWLVSATVTFNMRVLIQGMLIIREIHVGDNLAAQHDLLGLFQGEKQTPYIMHLYGLGGILEGNQYPELRHQKGPPEDICCQVILVDHD